MVVVEQDLVRFGKVLRGELVGWHLRCKAVERLRGEAGLGKKKNEEEEPGYGKVLNAFVSDDEEEEEEEVEEELRRRNGPVKIIEIEADYAVRQIDVRWSNGRTAALDVAKDGEITKAVVKSKDGARLADVARRAVGRIEGVVQRLSA